MNKLKALLMFHKSSSVRNRVRLSVVVAKILRFVQNVLQVFVQRRSFFAHSHLNSTFQSRAVERVQCSPVGSKDHLHVQYLPSVAVSQALLNIVARVRVEGSK